MRRGRARAGAALNDGQVARPDYADEDVGDDDEGGGSGGDVPAFIVLDRGRLFLRSYMIDGLRWEQYLRDDKKLDWRLLVYLDGGAGTARVVAHGDEAADILAQLGLPEDPPE